MAYSQNTQSRQVEPAEGWLNRMWQSIVRGVRYFFERGDAVVLFLISLILLMPAISLERSGWAEGLSLLIPVTLSGIVIGFLLARSRYSELTSLILSICYGTVIVSIIHTLAIPENYGLVGRFEEWIRRLQLELQAAESGVASDTVVFELFLSILFWFLVHNTVWQQFRLGRIWLAVVPPGIFLIGNNLWYEVQDIGSASLDIYIIIFLFASFLLMIHSHMEAREYEWYRKRMRYPANLRRNFLSMGVIAMLVLISVAWVLPAGDDSEGIDLGEPLEDINELLRRVFPPVSNRGIATVDYYGGDYLQLSGPVQLSDEEVLRVEVENNPGVRMYWRSTVYDTYQNENGIWTHNRSVRAYKESAGMSFNIGDLNARETITQEFTVLMPATSLVYAAPQPVEMGLGVDAELNCLESPGPDCVNQREEVDVAVIRARDPIRNQDRYTVRSSVSVANAQQLNQVPAQYPPWVTTTYLQGGGQISSNLRGLTQQIIEYYDAVTPYEKARAIEAWLRTNIAYDEFIPAPPAGADPLDWFVFDIRRGYCNYYATAMVMMLRSEGVPARMSAGFAQGEFRNGDYVIKESDAHTWVEVYFPGYGWVNFEPTADEESLDRPGDTPLDQQLFPTLTPFPTLTSTPVPTATQQAPEGNSQPPTATPTPTQSSQSNPPPVVTATPRPTETPTPTVTPSVTPVVPPDQQNVSLDENDSNLLRIVATILGIFLGLLLLLVVVGIGVFWWFENHGLGGLNPVQRAYARLGIYGYWIGESMTDKETPYERGQRLGKVVPEGEQPIGDIARLYTFDRFAPEHDDVLQRDYQQQARQSWMKARIAFIREKFRRRFRRG